MSKQIEMRKKIDELNEEYYRLFWRIEKNKKGLSKEQYEKAQEILFKQYEREYGLLNDTDGLELDKQLAELELMREKLETEIQIQQKTADQEQKEKKERLIPNDLPRRWWQLRARPNYAKQLAAEEVRLEVDMYFGKRESELERAHGRYDELSDKIYDIMVAGIPKPKGKRKGKAMQESLRILSQALSDILLPRVLINEEFEAAIRSADETEPAEAFAEPQADMQQMADESKEPKEQQDVTTGDRVTPEESGAPDPAEQTLSN